MKRLFLVGFLLLALPLMASHIVGGEFELLHIDGDQYRLNLKLYFDEVNGSPQAKEVDIVNGIFVKIFRSSDDALIMDNIKLNFTSQTDVDYTSQKCAVGELQTTSIIWTTTLTLSPEVFNDPGGYYVVWERCCRNYSIRNIFSDNPNVPGSGAIAAGQTFYLEFPPVVKDGQPFIDSTPRLFPPLSDYGCVGQPYYADFAGTDDDDDSLTYEIVTPLSTQSEDSHPFIFSRPYPEVQWRAGFADNNVMRGKPDIAISQDGLLTVTPTEIGLFVFGVKCEQFRDGVKIGESRRDFQMLVLDCQISSPPVVEAKPLNGTYQRNNINISFPSTVSDEERCVVVRVGDPDAFRVSQGLKEDIGIRIIPIGFKSNLNYLLPDVSTATLTPLQPTFEFPVCFDQCPIKPGVVKIGIISYDNACAVPLTDTVIVTIEVEPPSNEDPVLTPTGVTSAVLIEPDSRSWAINATDADGDTLDVSVVTDGFIFGEKGFSFENVVHVPGSYSADLLWQANCGQFDFSEGRTDFPVTVTVDDRDACNVNEPVTASFNLKVILPHSEPPEITTDLFDGESATVDKVMFESLQFGLKGTDVDNFPLTLGVTGVGFDPASVGVEFHEVSGPSPVTSDFLWNLLCGKVDPLKKSEYDFLMIVRDSKDRCGIYRADTITLDVRIAPALNNRPDLTLTALPTGPVVDGNNIKMIMGQELKLSLASLDTDLAPRDPVKIELIPEASDIPAGYTFNAVDGLGQATATFDWKPECSIFQNNVYTNNYVLKFRTTDDRCHDIKGDTVEVNLTVTDVDGGDVNFIPPNFITPNNDGCNDFFAMEELGTSSCGEENTPNLPKDNCAGHFTSIRIYNRWGNEVFTSNQRNFRWLPNGFAPGVYYYTLFFTNAEYKGSVTIMN